MASASSAVSGRITSAMSFIAPPPSICPGSGPAPTPDLPQRVLHPDAAAERIMGLLVDGRWQEDASRTKDGHFIRPATQFRNYVTADGNPGPSGAGGFLAERGRYHLYVSLACPWAHRTLIFRKLKKLEDVISVSVTEPLYGKTGWEFGAAMPGATPDTVNGKATLAEIYLLADPHYTGRVSVPVFWDKQRRTIVNNESRS